MTQFERYLVDSVIDDMARNSPALVIVDMSPCKYMFRKAYPTPCPEQFGHFDYLSYFSQDSRFAELWSNYVFLTDIGPFRDLGPYTGTGPFRVFRRVESASLGGEGR